MSQPVEPPDEVFCMGCGPGTALDADPAAHRVRCPRCGTESWLPGLPLFVVTGASGSGKSTITGPLRNLLRGCLVFETDVIFHVAALGWDTWRNTWLQLTHAVALGGQATVLTGSFTPDQLERLPARRLVGPIHLALLDCPDDLLAERLRARPAWRGTSSEAKITEHQRFAAWLRTRITPSFDTGAASAAEVADQVAAWVKVLLPSMQAPSRLAHDHALRERYPVAKTIRMSACSLCGTVTPTARSGTARRS